MPKRLLRRGDKKLPVSGRVHPEILKRLDNYVAKVPKTRSMIVEDAIALYLENMTEWFKKIESKEPAPCLAARCPFYVPDYKEESRK